MKNGFSLIELLVVVLILGILSSVALLQYNKSMQKARFANYVIWAKRIYDAEKLRFISHGSYSFNFAALNISVPEDAKFNIVQGNNLTLNNGMIFRLNKNNAHLQFNFDDVLFSLSFEKGTLHCYHYSNESQKKKCMNVAYDEDECLTSVNSCLVETFR